MISHRNGIAYLSHKNNNTRMIRGSYTTPSKSLAKNVEMHTTQTSLVSGLSRL